MLTFLELCLNSIIHLNDYAVEDLGFCFVLFLLDSLIAQESGGVVESTDYRSII